MKFALLISGQPRSVLESCENIYNKIILPNNTDVFLHSWIDPNMFGKEYYSNWLLNHRAIYKENITTAPASSAVPHNIETIMLDKYKPKKYIFEPQKFFEYDPIFDVRKMPSLNIQDALSQLYSIYMVNELKKQYEQENNFVYDVVMRIRFGMVFDSSIWPLSYFSSNNICFIPTGFRGFEINHAFLNHISICDHFVISNSQVMNIYSDTFNQLSFLVHNNYCHLQCEDVLGAWIRRVNNIPVAVLDISYRVNVK